MQLPTINLYSRIPVPLNPEATITNTTIRKKILPAVFTVLVFPNFSDVRLATELEFAEQLKPNIAKPSLG